MIDVLVKNPDNYDEDVLDDDIVKKIIYNINTKNVYLLSKI